MEVDGDEDEEAGEREEEKEEEEKGGRRCKAKDGKAGAAAKTPKERAKVRLARAVHKMVLKGGSGVQRLVLGSCHQLTLGAAGRGSGGAGSSSWLAECRCKGSSVSNVHGV